ncbi:hypothetical protein BDZ45DRAFT_685274 [Acephala macrosclerotiorum]|nr:hypothetical protein BDZ45DRAFT_685274 [Acephala macrosclerotiorum]
MSFNPSGVGMFRQRGLHQESKMHRSISGSEVRSDPTRAQRRPATGSLSPFGRLNQEVKVPTLSDPHNELVTIKAGDAGNMMEYKVYKQFATYYSPVLSAAFKRGFLEGATREIAMNDIDDPRVFGHIQAWMYNQEADLGITALEDVECEQLVDTWILADRLLMPKLQNAVIRRLMWKSLSKEQVLAVGDLYDRTMAGSMLRKWFVDKCAFETDEEIWVEAAQLLTTPRQFGIDIALAYRSSSMSPHPFHLFPGSSPMKARSYYVNEA